MKKLATAAITLMLVAPVAADEASWRIHGRTIWVITQTVSVPGSPAFTETIVTLRAIIGGVPRNFDVTCPLSLASLCAPAAWLGPCQRSAAPFVADTSDGVTTTGTLTQCIPAHGGRCVQAEGIFGFDDQRVLVKAAKRGGCKF